MQIFCGCKNNESTIKRRKWKMVLLGIKTTHISKEIESYKDCFFKIILRKRAC